MRMDLKSDVEYSSNLHSFLTKLKFTTNGDSYHNRDLDLYVKVDYKDWILWINHTRSIEIDLCFMQEAITMLIKERMNELSETLCIDLYMDYHHILSDIKDADNRINEKIIKELLCSE